MNLWIVVYSGFHVAGSVGPLPYDMNECLARAAEKNTELQAQVAAGKDREGNPISSELAARAAQIKFVCEHHEERPEIQEDQQ